MRFSQAHQRLIDEGGLDFTADAFRRARREIDAERRKHARMAPAAVEDRRLRAAAKALKAQKKAELTAALAKNISILKGIATRKANKAAYEKEQMRLQKLANAEYRRHIAAGKDIDEAIRLVAIAHP